MLLRVLGEAMGRGDIISDLLKVSIMAVLTPVMTSITRANGPCLLGTPTNIFAVHAVDITVPCKAREVAVYQTHQLRVLLS